MNMLLITLGVALGLLVGVIWGIFIGYRRCADRIGSALGAARVNFVVEPDGVETFEFVFKRMIAHTDSCNVRCALVRGRPGHHKVNMALLVDAHELLSNSG